MLLSNLAGFAEGQINRALSQDPGVGEQLAALDGRVMAVTVTGLDQTVFCAPAGQHVQLRTQLPEGQTADVHLHGRATDFLQLARSSGSDKQAALLSGSVRIEGDAMLAQRFAAIFEQLDLDWQAPLDDVLGPTVSGQIGQAVRGLAGWAKQRSERASVQAVSHLRDQSQDLVAGDTVQAFMEDVDQLRDGVDRAEARIKRLKKQQPD